MADEDIFAEECRDDLSDIPTCSEDSSSSDEDVEETEISSDSEAGVATNPGTASMAYDSDECDEEMETEWSDIDPPRNYEPFRGSSGPNIVPEHKSNAEDYGNMFIGDDLFTFIATETNKYHAQCFQGQEGDENADSWTDVTVPELKRWFALLILMGLTKKSRISEFWSTNPLMETPIFPKTMSHDRFKEILANIHFCDNENIHQGADRLFKIQYVMKYFARKFQGNFTAGQNISVHDGLIPWFGGLDVDVCNRSDITKFGVHIRMLCDSTTGYILNFRLCSGATQSVNSAIIELVEPFVGNWYNLYMDEYYNSIQLAKILLVSKIRVCGPIKRSQGMPDILKSTQLKVFESVFKRRGEVLLQLWRASKSKCVRMISTIHNAQLVNTGKTCKKTKVPIQKPVCITDYNRYMEGAYQADKYHIFNSVHKKTIKWSKKVVLYLFNCALFNAFRVYLCFNTKSRKKLRFHDFLLQIAEAWMLENFPQSGEHPNMPSTSAVPNPGPLNRYRVNIRHHQLVPISRTDRNRRRRCRICHSRGIVSTTNLMCRACKVPLHLTDCFAAYHLKYN